MSVITFNIDTQAPAADIALSSAPPLASGKYNVTLVLNGELSPLNGLPQLSFAPAGGSTSSVSLAYVSGSTWTGTFSVLPHAADGLAVFSFAATDAAGNSGTVINSGGSFLIKTSVSSTTAGIVRAPDNSAVTVPAGSWSSDISIRIDTASGDAVLDRAVAAAVNYGGMVTLPGSPYKEFTATETLTGVSVTQFNSPVTISIGYQDDDANGIVDGTSVRAEELRMFYLNRDRAQWELVQGQYLERAYNRVSAPSNHFSTYGLMAVQSGGVAAVGVVAYPNPCYMKNSGHIAIGGIPLSAANLAVRIYDQNGALVRTLTEASGEILTMAGGKEARWNGLNSSGDKAASGIYIYLIKGDGIKTTGRLGILW